MPSTYFFATKADLEPGLAALQAARPLQCARCEPRGCLESTLVPPFAPLSHRDELGPMSLPLSFNEDEVADQETDIFLVCDVGARIVVESRPCWWGEVFETTLCYQVVSTPVVAFMPGGLEDSASVISEGNLTAAYAEPESMRLYRQMEETLFQGFTRIYNYYYGPEALELGKAGAEYASSSEETWTYADLMESQEAMRSEIVKPVTGRLSLEESWDWLEAEGYEVHRHKDGTPDLYLRRPTQNCSVDHGFSLFRTFIENDDLAHLTIPYTYMGKIRSYQASFRQSDLSHSRLAAGLFTDCDFSDADFSGSLLANCYMGCTFEGAILKDVDFRSSWFEACTFAGAAMKGAKLLKQQAAMVTLSEVQRSEIRWYRDSDTGPDVGEW